jgi:hypothetical protein
MNSPPNGFAGSKAVVESKVQVVSAEHLCQMGLLRPDGLVTVYRHPIFYSAHEALPRFHTRFSGDDNCPATGPRQEVDKAKEGEGRWLLGRAPTPLQQATVEVPNGCLLGRDAQPEGGESLLHFLSESRGVLVVAEHGYEVVSEPCQPSVAPAALLEASFEPQV